MGASIWPDAGFRPHAYPEKVLFTRYIRTPSIICQPSPSFRTTMFFFKAVVALSVAVFTASAAPLFPSSNLKLEKRDDDLPARIPYIFPAPGTDPVSPNS